MELPKCPECGNPTYPEELASNECGLCDECQAHYDFDMYVVDKMHPYQ